MDSFNMSGENKGAILRERSLAAERCRRLLAAIFAASIEGSMEAVETIRRLSLRLPPFYQRPASGALDDCLERQAAYEAWIEDGSY